MLIRDIKNPIQLINMKDFGVDEIKIKNYLKNAYEFDYEWDQYLLRQNKIEFLKKTLSNKILEDISEEFLAKYYLGKANDSDLSLILRSLSIGVMCKFNEIKPTRKRLISNFNLKRVSGKWNITRISAKKFGQKDALVNSSSIQDYRLENRIFKELPRYLENNDLYRKLKFISANLYRKISKKPTYINIIVHHTIVFCYPNISATNSPEGVHQDGSDYIVSALVIDRVNVSGGESIIYGSDAKTEVFNATLQRGQGILQPDKNSDLWHTVTPIECIDNKNLGYRSTIGFDISIIETLQ